MVHGPARGPDRFAIIGAALAGFRLLATRPLLLALIIPAWAVAQVLGGLAESVLPFSRGGYLLASNLIRLVMAAAPLTLTSVLVYRMQLPASEGGAWPPRLLRVALFWSVLLASWLLIAGGSTALFGWLLGTGVVSLDESMKAQTIFVLLMAVAFGLWAWLGMRLSVAAPLVYLGRARALRSGWAITRGLQWRLVLLTLVVGLIGLVLLILAAALEFQLGVVSLATDANPPSDALGRLALELRPAALLKAALTGAASALAAVLWVAPGGAICGADLRETPDARAAVFD